VAARAEAPGLFVYVAETWELERGSAKRDKERVIDSLDAALSSLSPVTLAALLVAARVAAKPYDLERPSVDAIVTATGASRSRAYELAARLAELLASLAAAVGRPAKTAPPPASDAAAVTHEGLDFVMAHPGSVGGCGARQHYSDAFRHFVIELRAKHAALDVEAFAAAIHVPLGTVKDWLRDPAEGAPDDDLAQPATPPSPPRPPAEDAQMQTVLEAWTRWEGSFLDFCEHVRMHLHVPFGRDLIRRILDVHGARHPARRDGRSSDESASRGSFKTFFPGAQWVGDGMQVPVVVDGQRFVFNFELDVDAHSGAFVGASVRREEDAAAVIEAFRDGIVTTGAPPLALLLDNRPSNHVPEVDTALGETIRIRATPERPQNKAHVEGGFGLFSQTLPDLVLDTRAGPRELASGFLSIVIETWARTVNHRPRADRGGRSRAELYSDDRPTDEQIENARRELRETAARQERARRTLAARRRPEILELLDGYFTSFGLLDPERHFRIAIAGFPVSAIVDGAAIWNAKVAADTLPDGADARYLLGIVKNVSEVDELMAFAAELYDRRIEARDFMLGKLAERRDASLAGADINKTLAHCVDEALATTSELERTFWLHSLADVIRSRDAGERRALLLGASRRISATFAVPHRERQEAIRLLGDRVVKVS
jgi:hypothetical protein